MATWKDDTVAALASLGGEADLADIYKFVARRRPKKGPNWKSAVRFALQVYNPDSKYYSGGQSLFYSPARGRFGLRKPKSP